MHAPFGGKIKGPCRQSVHALQQGISLETPPHRLPSTADRVKSLTRYSTHRHARRCREGLTCFAAASAASTPEQSRENIRPAYNKYRTRADIEASYLKQWKEVTARGDGGQRQMTVLSVVAWWPLFFKYQVLPGFLRFFWWLLVWRPLTAVHHQLHCFTVKLGARLDAGLAARSSSGRQTFSLAMVMRRYHHAVSPLASAVHRWRLLKGVSDPVSTPKLEHPESSVLSSEQNVADSPEGQGLTSEGFAS